MIVFSDFDNTLYPHSDEHEFLRNLEAIKKFRKRGNLFCLATGRNQASLGRAWADYSNYLDYIIFDNGAVCVNRQGEAVFQETIPLDIAKTITDRITKKFGNEVEFVVYYDNKEWPEPDQDATKVRCWTTSVEIAERVVEEISTMFGETLCSFIARDVRPSNVAWMKNQEYYCAFVDTMSAKAGKYNAIRRLCEKFPNERVITVGDDTNDLAMIKNYDGYAMHNSVPEVLENVNPTHVVDSVSELLVNIDWNHKDGI